MKEKAILEKIKDYAVKAIQFKDDMTFEEFSNDLKPMQFMIQDIKGKM
jgi:predicted AAA+ superfamily ATPase